MTRVDKAAFVSAFITGLCLYAAIEFARMSPDELNDQRKKP